MIFISVDFPAPFSPTSAWISPLRNWMVTSSSARTPGNSLVMPLISSRTSLMSCSAAAARLRGGGSEEARGARKARPAAGRRRARRRNGVSRVAVRRLLPVDLLLLQIAALDQHLVEILLGDDVRREQDGGNVLLVVVHHFPPRVDGLALGDGDRHLDGLVSQLARVLEHGHALGALDDADGPRQLGVLAGDGDLAGEPLRRQGLDATAGGAVVRGEDRVDLVLVRGERLLAQLLRLGGLPVLDELVHHDLDVALV